MFDTPYICALSGVAPSEDLPEELDDGGVPESWVKVTLTRRFINAKWVAVQGVKRGMLRESLENIPRRGTRRERFSDLMVQIDAHYFAMEEGMDKYLEEEEEVYISTPEADPALMEEYNKVRETLGLEREEIEDEDEQPEPPIPFTKKEQPHVAQKD